MGRSQQTFSKTEKEKKRLKKREEKRKKMEARKLEKEENGSSGIPIAYVDHNGNLTDTPPDPSMKVKVKAKNIEIGIPKKEDVEDDFDPVRKGKVSFFNDSKGYGFVIDADTNEKYFMHISGIIDDVVENDKVTFELEKGQRGMNAVKVKKV
ncbi:DNA-binding protein [Winogradskyella sp. J14-2]|uniref:cold-shock protein n=1 Tax=Winogradskyella sp. J14-2 TaxID=1936080 RepID=UPI0009727122|nr:cold shock domain-containing protein [Winogradskyella sp. J14-2]APY07101.1 DNA-binding protein [Winogradskyella sp. J14-2]